MTEVIDEPVTPKPAAKRTLPAYMNDTLDMKPTVASRFSYVIDTDTLLMPGILDWLENTLLPALAESQKRVRVFFRSTEQLMRISEDSRHAASSLARAVLPRLSALANAGKIRIQADPQPVEGIDPDNTYRVMVEALLTNQFKERVAMITQSMTLAEQLVQVAGSGAFTQTAESRVFYFDGHRRVLRDWRPLIMEDAAGRLKACSPIEEEVAAGYRLMVDTSSLMVQNEEQETNAVEAFFEQRFIPLLENTRNPVIVAEDVRGELGNHVRRAVEPQCSLALRATQLLDYLASESLCVTANWGTAYQQERAFADRQFVRFLNAYHGKDNLCLITQDRALAQLLTELARQPTPAGVRTRVAYIDHCNWYLREWTQRLKRVRDNSGPEGQAQPERRYPGENRHAKTARQSKPNAGRSGEARSEGGRSGEARSAEGQAARPTRAASIQPFPVADKVAQADNIAQVVSSLPSVGGRVSTLTLGELTLEKELSEGGEGIIYTTSCEGLVCKIWHRNCLTLTRFDKLKLMLSRQVRIKGVCWPKELVWNAQGEIVGYVMEKAQGQTLRSAIYIKQRLQANFPQWNRMHLVELACTILRKIDKLHQYNVLIGDINPDNILLVDEKTVYFVDTDSYQVGAYPCPVGTDTFTPAARQGMDYSTFLRTKEDELFAVATLLFVILFPGKAPYSAMGGGEIAENIRNRNFPYRKIEEGEVSQKPLGVWPFIWSHLHWCLKKEFLAVFEEGKSVGIKAFLAGLKRYKKDMGNGKSGTAIFPDGYFVPAEKAETLICPDCNKSYQRNKTWSQPNGQALCPNCARLKRINRELTSITTPCSCCGKAFKINRDKLQLLASQGKSVRCHECFRGQMVARLPRSVPGYSSRTTGPVHAPTPIPYQPSWGNDPRNIRQGTGGSKLGAFVTWIFILIVFFIIFM